MKRRSLVVLLVITAAAVGLSVSAQQTLPQFSLLGFGPQQVFPLFFQAITQSDLVVLQNGGIVSATVTDETLPIAVGNATQNVKRADAAFLLLADSTTAAGAQAQADIILLKSGQRLSGKAQFEKLNVQLVSGESIALQKSQIKGLVFKFTLPEGLMRQPGQPVQPGQGQPAPGQHMGMVFRGLRGGTLGQTVMQSLTKYDMLLFPSGGLMSAAVPAETAFTINSPTFGVHTFKKDDVSAIAFGARDTIALKTGDQITGTLQLKELQVQSVYGVADARPVTLSKEKLLGVIFKVPASFFGTGGRPGLGAGPGK